MTLKRIRIKNKEERSLFYKNESKNRYFLTFLRQSFE
jgi:hypothetical protein